jgi:hypothetical protein
MYWHLRQQAADGAVDVDGVGDMMQWWLAQPFRWVQGGHTAVGTTALGSLMPGVLAGQHARCDTLLVLKHEAGVHGNVHAEGQADLWHVVHVA